MYGDGAEVLIRRGAAVLVLRCGVPRCGRTALVTSFRATLIFVAEIQNVTLSLPRGLLKQAKRLAADEETSVSSLMARALARLVDERMRFSGARRRSLAAMRGASSLGTRGTARWTRDELHER